MLESFLIMRYSKEVKDNWIDQGIEQDSSKVLQIMGAIEEIYDLAVTEQASVKSKPKITQENLRNIIRHALHAVVYAGNGQSEYSRGAHLLVGSIGQFITEMLPNTGAEFVNLIAICEDAISSRLLSQLSSSLRLKNTDRPESLMIYKSFQDYDSEGDSVNPPKNFKKWLLSSQFEFDKLEAKKEVQINDRRAATELKKQSLLNRGKVNVPGFRPPPMLPHEERKIQSQGSVPPYKVDVRSGVFYSDMGKIEPPMLPIDLVNGNFTPLSVSLYEKRARRRVAIAMGRKNATLNDIFNTK